MTKVIFAPSKFVRISERDSSSSRILHERVRIYNTLNITDFGDVTQKIG